MEPHLTFKVRCCEEEVDMIAITPKELEFDFESFSPPPKWLIDKTVKVQNWYFQPTYYWDERVPLDRAVMLVGNHTIFGLADAPSMINHLYQSKNLFIRGLGDSINFEQPIWKHLAKWFGTVEGSPENCQQILESGQSVLVFPGGAREICKRKGEQHKIVWKNRTGFARTAIASGCEILPFASVGPDDMVDILYDAQDFSNSFIGKKLLSIPKFNEMTRDGDLFFPISSGIPLTPFAKPEKFYIGFGEPICTRKYQGNWQDKSVQWELRERVTDSIEKLMIELKAIREKDSSSPLRKLLTKKVKT